MKLRNAMVFLISIIVFLLVAGHRFGDSGHAITMISQKGGKFRHPVHIKEKYGRATVIVTGKVLPPYHGDAKVALEGIEGASHAIYFSGPVIDLGLTELPSFEDNIISGLKPGKRVAFWVLIENIEKENICHLSFYDTKTDQPILRLPILFEGEKGENASEECH